MEMEMEMEMEMGDVNSFNYAMGLACPPLDYHHMDFGFLNADHQQPIDDLCGFFDDFNDNGDLFIKGSHHHHHHHHHQHQHQQPVAVAVEKKTIILKQPQQNGKGKELKLLLKIKKLPAHGKGKEMRLLLASKNKANKNEVSSTDPPSSMSEKRVAPPIADNHHSSKVPKVAIGGEHKLEQAKKRVMSTTETAVTKPIITKKRVLSTDPPSISDIQFNETTVPAIIDHHPAKVPKVVAEDDEHKLELTIKKVLHKYEEAAEAKRKRRAVVIDYVPPKPNPKPNKSSPCRFKSKKLQKLYAAHKIFH